uniref:Uncharacterized protein n=1 Tax=viral metagenome TaxID=1070528 RepID=A0A6C0JS36_9ZZZZ
MSLSNHTYNLRAGQFGLCSGYWDEKAQVFRRADETEQRDCCMKTCKPFVDTCANICPKAAPKYQKLCYKTCDDIVTTCGDFCNLSSPVWGANNPIFKGTKEKECGDDIYNPLNIDCIKKNKDAIINICRHNCTPTSKLDCEEHCKYSYNIISDKKANPLYFEKKIKELRGMSIKQTKGKGDNVQYIIYALAIVGIVFGIWILVKM